MGVLGDSNGSEMSEIKLWRSESTTSLKKSSVENTPEVTDMTIMSDTISIDDGNLSDASISSAASICSTASTSSSSRIKKYFCEYDGCKKSFSRPSTLTDHQQSVHLGIKKYQCDQCESKFSRKSHLERHLISHSTEKPFCCSICSKGLTTRQQLKRHEITHTKSFKCTYENCEESFYKHPQLRAHILSVHLEKLKCQFCNKNFQRPYRLRNHIAKHHNPDVENPYQCSYNNCMQSFKLWTTLQQHVKNDHPKIKCEICDKACVGEIGLRMHMKIHDDKLVIKNWKCKICEEANSNSQNADFPEIVISFAKKNELLEHYKKEHKEQIPKELLIEVKSVEAADGENDNVGQKDEQNVTKKRKITDAMIIINEEKLEKYLFGDDDRDVEFNGIIPNNPDQETSSGTRKGINALNLLMDTVGRKFNCHYADCKRTFKTKDRFDKHIEKHKIHQLKLKIAMEKEEVAKKDKVEEVYIDKDQ